MVGTWLAISKRLSDLEADFTKIWAPGFMHINREELSMAGEVDLTLGVETKSTWTWSAADINVV